MKKVEPNRLKIDELAKRTGLTVCTLHHYDRIGRLCPSRLSESGHRFYTEQDIARLQQIVSLKQLCFSLEEIKAMIERPDFDPAEALRLQLERLDAQIELQLKLRPRLQHLVRMNGDAAACNG